MDPCDAGKKGGFTLVEIAIVMVVIGVMIGGIMKMSEMIENTRIAGTITQIKTIQSAMNMFADKYAITIRSLGNPAAAPVEIRMLPGNMPDPGIRLPNCTAWPCNLGGDGIISGTDLDTLTPATIVARSHVDNAGPIRFCNPPAGEQIGFWSHLAAAGMMDGIDPSKGINVWGGFFPRSLLQGGGFDVGWWNGGNFCNAAPAVTPAGTYLALHGAANSIVGVAIDRLMTGSVAHRIDFRLDDGNPFTGRVVAARPAAAAADCHTATVYNQNSSNKACSLYIRIGD